MPRLSHARATLCQCLAPACLSDSVGVFDSFSCLHAPAFVCKGRPVLSRHWQAVPSPSPSPTHGPGLTGGLVLLNHNMWRNGLEPHCSVDQMFLRSQRAYVFKGHTAGWLELPSEVGCELNEALCVIIDTMCDPRPNISVSCPFMLNGVPVKFDVRLRQDRSIHLTTIRFSSGTGEVQFGARPINDGYWSPSISPVTESEL